ncbi:MAG: NAD(+) synthase [Rikenellaceae bacterium]
MEQVYNKLVGGVKAYFASNNFEKTVIALSGGIDSAVVLALAVRALGSENVRVLLLPSQYSSGHSVSDSLDMAERCGIVHDTVCIEPLYTSVMTALDPIFSGTEAGLAEENLQARLRMVVTMAVSNKTGALMLNTSNRSEIMVGYGTLYGDTSGAISVIGGLYKTEVYDLARYINENHGDLIPQNIIDKAPSAELRPGQKDSDSLPDYPVLDQILRLMVDEGLTCEAICEKGFDSATVDKVYTLWTKTAFKRLQLPPALEVR